MRNGTIDISREYIGYFQPRFLSSFPGDVQQALRLRNNTELIPTDLSGRTILDSPNDLLTAYFLPLSTKKLGAVFA